jgi:acylphosphatase
MAPKLKGARMKTYKFIIKGKVQGVFYRKSVAENMKKAGILGYVKNLPNKDVEAVVKIEEERLDEVLQILRKGSSRSVVESIEVFEIDDILLSDEFEIRY